MSPNQKQFLIIWGWLNIVPKYAWLKTLSIWLRWTNISFFILLRKKMHLPCEIRAKANHRVLSLVYIYPSLVLFVALHLYKRFCFFCESILSKICRFLYVRWIPLNLQIWIFISLEASVSTVKRTENVWELFLTVVKSLFLYRLNLDDKKQNTKQ